MKLLNINEVADRLSIRPSTIRKWVLQRKITTVRLGRCVRIPVSAVDELIQAGLRKPVRGEE